MEARRILIFNVNWLGDVLFSTAAIRNIRYNFPESFIACIVPESCRPLLEGNPHLSEIIIFEEKRRHKGILSKLGFIQLLRKKKFDLVFLLHRSFSRTLICRLADIPQRIGYYTKKRRFLLTQSILPPRANTLHRIDYYLNLVARAGLAVKDRFTEFFVSEEEVKFVDNFLRQQALKKDDFLVGINPGGNWALKRWPKEYFARLSARLIKEFHAKIIVTGSSTDRSLAEEIQSLMRQKVISTCGSSTLKQLGALCKRLDLFITADTGPLHIAASVGAKKIIAIFGPTDPAITGPDTTKNNILILKKDVGCKVPCYELKCKDNRCMKAITVEDVMDKIK